MIYELNDIELNVEMTGSGPPLLLLHGFTGSLKTWSSFLPVFTKQYRVITLDILGHGKSSAPTDPKRYTIEKAADDIIALLDRLHIDKTHVLGYSMGGRLALMFACTYPERVRSLILESASPGLRTAKERRARRERDEQLAAFIDNHPLEAFIDYWQDIPLFHTQKRVPLKKRQELRKRRLLHKKVGLANSLRGMGTGHQPSLWGCLPNLVFPVRLLVGEYDEKFRNIAEEMDKLLPKSEVIVSPKAGHATHLENEVFFQDAVMNFLHKIGTRRKSNGD